MSECLTLRESGRTIEDLSTELSDICWGDGGETEGGVDGEEDGGVGEGEFDELVQNRGEPT